MSENDPTVMISSHVGPDDWPARWSAMSRALDTVDWSRFRQDPALMHGIETKPDKLSHWLNRCAVEGVSPAIAEDPDFGEPVGQLVHLRDREIFATASSLKSACHAHVIERAITKHATSITYHLEIGGGYGMLARAIHLTSLTACAILIDAKPCMRMQRVYLEHTVPWLEVCEYSAGQRYDLVTNVMSFGEMHASEVARYFGIIQRQITPGGVFYCANRLQRETNFENYPYDPHWKHAVSTSAYGKQDTLYVDCVSVRDLDAKSAHPSELL